jgi:hypothetical protein
MKFFHLFFLYAFGASCLSAIAQQASPDSGDHLSGVDALGVDARGDQGMGFSHEKTTHHFYLLADGALSRYKATSPPMQLPRRLSVSIW